MVARRLWNRLALGAVIVGAIGCGGTGEGADANNAFVGLWNGSWDSNGLQQTGTLDLAVYFDGSVVGTMSIDQLALTGNVVGKITKAGDLEAIAGFGSIGNYVLKGGVALTQTNTMASSGNIRFLSKDYGFDFDLPPKSGGSETSE
ncbi:MAG: hypothetical protein HONBIEJF_01240 [Fimbriimonadaceae bacterium]|nr:hypothetical protein [Fimbriimonadaceae bacterium]